VIDGKSYATEYDEDLDEVMGTLERKQKILAKIICVPGKKTYIAKWMKQTYEILLKADPEASIVTPSGLKISNLTDFPTGKKFQTAFLPIQSEDTKKITMNFHLKVAPALNKIKAKHRRLVKKKHGILF
jgi:DNA polymerase III alpha subunit (gram-positive type)